MIYNRCVQVSSPSSSSYPWQANWSSGYPQNGSPSFGDYYNIVYYLSNFEQSGGFGEPHYQIPFNAYQPGSNGCSFPGSEISGKIVFSSWIASEGEMVVFVKGDNSSVVVDNPNTPGTPANGKIFYRWSHSGDAWTELTPSGSDQTIRKGWTDAHTGERTLEIRGALTHFSVGDHNGANTRSRVLSASMSGGCLNDMSATFNKCVNMTHFDTTGLNTKLITIWNRTFQQCSSLTTITGIEYWDMSGAINLRRMFDSCSSLTNLSIGNWDTGQVNNLENFIFGCTALENIDVLNWDVTNVGSSGTTPRTKFAFAFHASSSTSTNNSVLNQPDFSRWCVEHVPDLTPNISVDYFIMDGYTQPSWGISC